MKSQDDYILVDNFLCCKRKWGTFLGQDFNIFSDELKKIIVIYKRDVWLHAFKHLRPGLENTFGACIETVILNLFNYWLKNVIGHIHINWSEAEYMIWGRFLYWRYYHRLYNICSKQCTIISNKI